MRPQLEALAQHRPDLRVRQIELPRGGSAVGNQFMIRSIPHLMLYQGRELVSSDLREVMETLIEEP